MHAKPDNKGRKPSGESLTFLAELLLTAAFTGSCADYQEVIDEQACERRKVVGPETTAV